MRAIASFADFQTGERLRSSLSFRDSIAESSSSEGTSRAYTFVPLDARRFYAYNCGANLIHNSKKYIRDPAISFSKRILAPICNAVPAPQHPDFPALGVSLMPRPPL
jgi:hypothetical protein